MPPPRHPTTHITPVADARAAEIMRAAFRHEASRLEADGRRRSAETVLMAVALPPASLARLYREIRGGEP